MNRRVSNLLAWCLVLAAATAGCKKKPQASAEDASATVVAPPVTKEAPDSAPPEPEAGPTEAPRGALSLVAVGKRPGAKIVWLRAFGDRVWLSGTNLDAYADGDGPLVRAPDLLAGLPYVPSTHYIRIAGRYPHLYALRFKKVNDRLESPEATAFVLREGKWAQAKPLANAGYPHAFVPWGDGALVMDSQTVGNASPSYYLDGPGTSFEYVAPDGTVSRPKIGLEARFMAWDASSDGTTLALLGTLGVPPPPDGIGSATGIWVARGTAKGEFVQTRLVPIAKLEGLEQYASAVFESGQAAIVRPPKSTTDATFRPRGAVFVVKDGKLEIRSVPHAAAPECMIQDAAMLGDDAYVVRTCFTDDDAEATTLYRIPRQGAAEVLRLPSLAGEGDGARAADAGGGRRCKPASVLARGAADLWVIASCAKKSDEESVPAIFRAGRPQTPVILP